jgi:uncharacterized integral membrane protein
MKRLLKLLLLVPVALVVVAVADTNRHFVLIYLDPFAGAAEGGTQISAPLYIVVFLAIMLGAVLGGVATYFEQGKYRRAARRARNEADSLRAEIARLSGPRPGEKRKVS